MPIYSFPTSKRTPLNVDENGNCKCGISGTTPGSHKWQVESLKVEAPNPEEAWGIALQVAKDNNYEIFFWPSEM
jgi:hypothetical protein